jgi:hypothetical protein
MIGRKALTGLSLLCALAFCAFAAPSAFAATTGTTAVTCVPEGGAKDYSDAHCDNTAAGGPGTGGFGHVALTANPTKEVQATSLENIVLSTTAGGLETEIVCTGADSTFTIENSLVGEEHKITVKEFSKITYTGCTVPKPAGQECKVRGLPDEAGSGMITTNALKGESVAGPSMGIKFQPAVGESFGTLVFSGCKTAGLNKEYAVTGSVTSEPSGTDNPKSAGATLIINQPKEAGSPLKLAGQGLGLKCTSTVEMEGGNPIATTAP